MQRLIRFWREYAHRYRWVYLVGLGFLLATNVLTVAIPDFLDTAITALEERGDVDEAQLWAIAIIGAGLVIIVVRTLSRTLFFNPGRTVEFRVKNDLFGHLLKMPADYFDRMRPGELISRGTNDTNSVRGLIGYGSLALFNVVLSLVLTTGQMLRSDLEMTLWCVAPLVVAVVILRYAIRAMFRIVAESQQQIAVLSDRILESYNGVDVIHSFNAGAGVRDRFDEANDRLRDLGLQLARISAWMLPIVSVVGNICLVLILYFGGRRVIEDTLSLGQLAAFAGYVSILVNALISLGWLINAVQRGYIALGRVNEVLDAPVGRVDGTAPIPPAGTGGHGFSVRGLTFRYPVPPSAEDRGVAEVPEDPESMPAVLDDVSFEVRPGETVGIFGQTGCGKTSLLRLLGRVYDPPPGTVLIDGVDLNDVAVDDYWKEVAVVPQESFLFSRSIRENIALSAPLGPDGEAIDDERVHDAARDAALLDDLEALPDGLETTVGERGVTLSGGQRQRTALARAFYRPFNALLLDDVMSAVDHATEKRLIDAVYARAKGVTTIIVSHRVSVLARADRVLVLEKGRLVGEGTHASLIAEEEGPYHRAWRLQSEEDASVRDARDGVSGPGEEVTVDG